MGDIINMTDLINTVITLFIIILIAYAAAKAGFLDDKFTKKLSNFVICICQPFMIVGALTSVEFTPQRLLTGLEITGIGFIVMGVCAVIGYFSVKWFKDPDERKLGEYAMVFANTGFMGFPVMKALFGDEGAFYGAFFVITFHITLWTYGISIFARNRDDIKIKPLNMILNYGTVPVIIGILLYVLQVKFPTPVTSAIDMMSDLCAPLAMIIVGSIVATVPLKKLFLDGRLYYICLFRLILLPLIVGALAILVGLPDDFVYLFVTLTALPTATNAAMYAQRYDISPQFGAKISSVTTLLSTGTIPLMLWLTSLALGLRG